MKIQKTLTALAALMGLTASTWAAISVPGTGYSTDFASTPAAGDWRTKSVTPSSTTAITTPAQMNTAMQTNTVATITAALGTAATSPMANAGTASYVTGVALQTRPTGNSFTILMGVFVNNTGTNATSVRIQYDFARPGTVAAEQLNGYEVYYSRTGGLDGWTNIPGLTITSDGTISADVNLDWPDGSTLYLAFGDDNGSPTDSAFQVDNFSIGVIAGTEAPASITLTSPANGAQYSAPAAVPLAATVTGAGITGVGYYDQNGLLASAFTPPYSATSPGLAAGSYTISAYVTNGGGSVVSPVTSTITVTNVPLTITLTTPVDGTPLLNPADVIVQAAVAGTVPITGVGFANNAVLYDSDFAAPYSNQISGLTVGTYTITATATNSDNETATATATITVREAYAELTPGAAYTEDFNSMLTTGIATPQGWYVGAAIPISGMVVRVDDGSTPANAAILGFNYGTTGDDDRALGTAPTGADRNTELRLINKTGSNLLSFVVKYDGETWRTHSAAFAEILTNHYSYDNGATWIEGPISLNYTNPFTNTFAVAVNGNDSANRVADITDTITPPNPVPPNGIIRVRFFNRNDGGTDGGLAVDNFSLTGTSFSESPFSASLNTPADGVNVYGGCANGLAVVAVTASGSGNVTNISFQLDGGTAVNDSTAPYSYTFTGVSWGSHTITAVAKDFLGNTTNMVHNITVIGNQAPTIAITNTFAYGLTNAPGVAYHVGDAITNQLLIADETVVTNVAWYVNGAHRLNIPANQNRGTIVLNDVLAGNNLIYAVATDDCGLSSTSAVVSVVATNPAGISVIVANGSTWSYHSTNFMPVLQGTTNWYDVGYDSSAWLTGAGELGAGDASSDLDYNGTDPNNPETTVIDFGPVNTRYLGVYFRHTFNVANPAAFTNLIVRALRDDGIVVYLNGIPIFTNQMTATWPTAYGTLASGTANDGTLYFEANVDPALLVSGQNVLAAEVHQNAATSSDVSFDLMLWGQEGVTSVPDLAIVNNGDGSSTISWANTGTFRVFSSADVAAPRASWTEWTATTPTLNGGLNRWELIVPSNAGVRFFDLRP